MRGVGLAAALLSAVSPGWAAAGSERAAVLQTIERLFDAMAARDAGGVKAVLAGEGYIYSIRGEAPAQAVALVEFPARVAAAREPLRERIFRPRVFIRGRVATVWAEYDFHRGEQFSHCGVDSFQLVKTEGGWRICGLAYTVETSGCPSRGPLRER